MAAWTQHSNRIISQIRTDVSPEQLRVPEEKQRNNPQISKHPLSKLNCLSHRNEVKTIRPNQRSDDGGKDCLHTSLVFSLSNC